MVEKVIKPIDGAARSAAVSKYSSDRQSGERGRKQQFSDSCKPNKPEKNESGIIDKFFASDTKKAKNGASDFEILLRKVWEDNIRMQESAKALEQTPQDLVEVAYVMGINSVYRPIIKK